MEILCKACIGRNSVSARVTQLVLMTAFTEPHRRICETSGNTSLKYDFTSLHLEGVACANAKY